MRTPQLVAVLSVMAASIALDAESGRAAPTTVQAKAAPAPVVALDEAGERVGQATQQRSEARNLTTEELYKRVLPSIMTLVVDKPEGLSMGTAFLVIKDGLALTAWHLVKDARRAVVRFSDSEEFEVSGLVDKDDRRDLALIRVKVFGRPAMTLEAADPSVGSRAYVVGSPRGMEFSISDGLVSQVQTIEGVKQFQFTCPASPGNSGGPLINEKAQVIGVVSWQVRNGQNLNFAVPISYALGLDTTLPTQPLSSVKSAGKLSSAMDSESFGPILVKAFVARYDAFVDLIRDADRVTAKNGYQSGVGPSVYAAQTILKERLQQLGSIPSSDSKRDALRTDLAKTLVSMLEALDLYIKAAREAAVQRGWTPVANELLTRSMGAIAATRSVLDEVGKAMVAEYSSLLPLGLQTVALEDVTGFLLGVNVSSSDSLVFAYVSRSGLAASFGLQSGDRILLAGGTAPKNIFEFKEQIKRAAGSKLKIRVRTPNGTEKDLEVRVPKQLPAR